VRRRGRRCSGSCGRSDLAKVERVSDGLELGRRGRKEEGGRANHTPPVHKDDIATFGCDGLRVLHRLPWELGEGLALYIVTCRLGFEAVFLAVARVPDPVHKKVRHEQCRQGNFVPPVHAGIMVRKVDGAMTVAQWNSGKVPKYEHEPQFFIIHIPGRDYAFFSFGAGIRIQEMHHTEKSYFAGDIAVLLVLPSCCAEGEEKKDVPWYSDLEEHLEIEQAKHSWVELGTHEEVIDWIAGHAVGGTSEDGGDVCDKGGKEARDDGDGHYRPEFVNDAVDFEEAGCVKNGRESEGSVQRPNTGAIVDELSVSCMGERFAFCVDSGEEKVAGSFEQEEGPVYRPCPW
jgi:hypothetical protein